MFTTSMACRLCLEASTSRIELLGDESQCARIFMVGSRLDSACAAVASGATLSGAIQYVKD